MNDDANFILPHKRRQLIIWTILCLMPVIGMAIDLISPSLPAIANELHVSHGIAKNAIAIYMLGYALGNFFTGFLTDAFGRQKLMRLVLIGFVLTSLLPIIFPHIEILLLTRFFQGLTLGGIAVVARAIFSDILPGAELTRMGVLIGSMFGLGPVIGPLIGGYLQYYLGWQSCFVFFAIIASIGFIAIFIIVPETHFNRHPLNIRTIKRNILEVLNHKQFMALIVIMGSVYSLIISFNTIGPFLIQTQLHYTPIFFGHMALWMGMAFLTATFICRHLLKTHTVERLFLISINVVFMLAIFGVIVSYFYPNSIILISIISAFMFFACGFLFPMSMGKGLSLFRHIAGTAAATMYLINVLMTSLSSFILSFINIQSAIPLIWTYLLLISICVITYWTAIHPPSGLSGE